MVESVLVTKLYTPSTSYPLKSPKSQGMDLLNIDTCIPPNGMELPPHPLVVLRLHIFGFYLT